MRRIGKGSLYFIFMCLTGLMCLVFAAASLGWRDEQPEERARTKSAADVYGLAVELCGRTAAVQYAEPRPETCAALGESLRSILQDAMTVGRRLTEWRSTHTRDGNGAAALTNAIGGLASDLARFQENLPELERSFRALERARDIADDMIRILLYDLAADAAPHRGRADVLPPRHDEGFITPFIPALLDLAGRLARSVNRPVEIMAWIRSIRHGGSVIDALAAFNEAAGRSALAHEQWRAQQRTFAQSRERVAVLARDFAQSVFVREAPANKEQLVSLALAALGVWLLAGLVLIRRMRVHEEAPPPAPPVHIPRRVPKKEHTH